MVKRHKKHFRGQGQSVKSENTMLKWAHQSD